MLEARIEQSEVVEALLGETERQGLTLQQLACKMNKNPDCLRLIRNTKRIGIHTLFDMLEALDIEICLVNREGVNIL